MNRKGFSLVIILLLLVTLSIVGLTYWKISSNNNSSEANQSNNTYQNNQEPETTKPEPNLSESWLLRQSSNASIRVPDGFNILANQNELFNFYLPDEPQGTLTYTKGVPAKVVGEPHKHFGLGLIVAFNQEGLNDRGTLVREFKTYSNLDVSVKLFEQTSDPTGVDFPKGSKHLKYTVKKNEKYINVDYVYLSDGLINIIDEMVKSTDIK